VPSKRELAVAPNEWAMFAFQGGGILIDDVTVTPVPLD